MDLSILDAIRSMNSGLPFNLEFAITRNCNSQCLMCDQWKKNWMNELDLEEIRKIFSSYDGFKVVGITGGEPTLRKDLSEVMKIIYDTQPHLKRMFVTSNGFLPDVLWENMEMFLAHCRRDLYYFPRKDPFKLTALVSIDGNKEIHNRIRGREFAYDKAVESLQLMHELKANYPEIFNFGSVSTYGAFNYKEYDAVLAELKSLHERFETEPAFCFVWFGNLYDHADQQSVDYGYLKAVEKDRFKIIRFIKSCNGSSVLNGRRLFWLFSSRFARDPGKQVIPCEAAKIRYFLESNGSVFPCVIWQNEIVNMRDPLIDYDFNKLFQHERARMIHELVKTKQCPGCYLTCEFIPTMMAHPFITARKFMEEILSIRKTSSIP